jgi:protein-tyrosine phosphatase
VTDALRSTGPLVLVCTANVCRSPHAERVVRARLAGRGWLGDVAVASAGTRAAEGVPMCEVSASLLEQGEAAPDGHVARQATREIVEDAGLVLVMEREQRGEIARLAPGSQSKVFTLREIAPLAEEAALRIEQGAERPRDLAELARLLHSVRGFRAPAPLPEPKRRPWWRKAEEPADPLTIVDGHGRPEPEHVAAVTDVRATTVAVADAFADLAGLPR